MNEERRMILEMLQEGAISVEEAERLMEALPAEESRQLTTAAPARAGVSPKRVVVLVTENGKQKVNVRVPFSLVRVGLKMGKSIGAISLKSAKDDPQAQQALDILNNIDVDELLASIDDGEITLPYAIGDVDDEDSGDQVRVVLE